MPVRSVVIMQMMSKRGRLYQTQVSVRRLSRNISPRKNHIYFWIGNQEKNENYDHRFMKVFKNHNVFGSIPVPCSGKIRPPQKHDPTVLFVVDTTLGLAQYDHLYRPHRTFQVAESAGDAGLFILQIGVNGAILGFFGVGQCETVHRAGIDTNVAGHAFGPVDFRFFPCLLSSDPFDIAIECIGYR